MIKSKIVLNKSYNFTELLSLSSPIISSTSSIKILIFSKFIIIYMTSIVEELTSPFFLSTAAATLVGVIGLILRYCYKIKCEDTTLCCNLIAFHRNVNDELRVDLQQMQMTENPNPRRRSSLMNASQLEIPQQMPNVV